MLSQSSNKSGAGNIRQAFILAAGLGTRLRPLTNAVPKMMLPVADGKPLLEHIIEQFRDQGITDFIINLHYLPDIITVYFGDGSRLGVRIRYSDERDALSETGGALKKAESLLDEEFIFMYGDELHFLDMRPMVEQHRAYDAIATIMLKNTDTPANGDIAEFAPESRRLLKWYTRPHGVVDLNDHRMLNAGIYVLSKRILDYIPADRSVKFDGEVIPRVMTAGKSIYVFPTSETIIDIGTIEKYEAAKEYYREHRATK